MTQYETETKPQVTQRDIHQPKCHLVEGDMGIGDNVTLKKTLEWIWENRKDATVHVVTYDNYIADDNIARETFSIYYE